MLVWSCDECLIFYLHFLIEKKSISVFCFPFLYFLNCIKGQILNIFFIKHFLTNNFRLENVNVIKHHGIKSLEYSGIQIDEDKWKFIGSKLNIWDHFKIAKFKYVNLNYNEKMHMLKRFYKNLLPVYTSQGKPFVSCKYCVSLDNGTKQNCLKCKVNVIHYTCYLYDDRKLICPVKNNKMNMLSVLEDFNKQEK